MNLASIEPRPAALEPRAKQRLPRNHARFSPGRERCAQGRSIHASTTVEPTAIRGRSTLPQAPTGLRVDWVQGKWFSLDESPGGWCERMPRPRLKSIPERRNNAFVDTMMVDSELFTGNLYRVYVLYSILYVVLYSIPAIGVSKWVIFITLRTLVRDPPDLPAA